MRALEKTGLTRGDKGRFPFNQNFRKFGNSGKWYRNFSQKVAEILKAVEFSKCEFSKFREQSWSWMERKLPLNFFSKIWLYVARLASFFGNFGKCCSILLWKLPKIQTKRFGWMGSAYDWLVQKIGLRRLLRLDAIKAEPSFLLLTQKTGLTSPDDWAAVLQRLDAIKAEPSFLLLTQEEDRRRFSWQVALL